MPPTKISESFQRLTELKEELSRQQNSFKRVLEKTYPVLMTIDSDALLSDMDSELDALLSSSVINKTGRFLLPAKGGWKKHVVLTRNPGLRFPHESYVLVQWSEMTELRQYRILKKSQNSSYGVTEIDFSSLVGNPKIDQVKLQKFIGFLKGEYFSLSRRIRDQIVRWCTSPQNCTAAVDLEIGHVGICADNRSFYLVYDSKSGTVTWSAHRFADFNNCELENEELEIVRNWDKIHAVLLKLEEKKGKYMAQLKKWIDDFKDENRAFRVLNKLTS